MVYTASRAAALAGASMGVHLLDVGTRLHGVERPALGSRADMSDQRGVHWEESHFLRTVGA